MSTPTIAPAPATAPAPPPPPAPRAPQYRTMLYFGAGVAIAVAVLLVVFVVVPASTGSSSGGTVGAVLTYSQARTVADSTVAGYQGGGWSLLGAAGIVSATNATLLAKPGSLGNLSRYCDYTLLTGTSDLTVPGFTGNRSLGESPAWEFGYRNASGGIAFVTVTNGHATVFATLTGPLCSLGALELFTPVPGNAINSSRAAAAVEPMAAAFLAAHPNASALYGLNGAYADLNKSVPAEWSILYSTCAVSTSPSGTGDQFTATVNPVTGEVLGWNTTTGVSCPLSGVALLATSPGTAAHEVRPAPSLGARPSGPG